jgi:hypothetical protein
MKTSTWKRGAWLVMAVGLLYGFSPICTAKSGGEINICKQVSAGQLKQLYRKHLYPTASENECFWSEKPGGMADMDIQVRDADLPLRDYFAKPLPSRFKLVKITDLGDGGLMTVGEGVIGVVVIRKGDRILQSSPGFLEIEPGSKKQTVLWDIYRHILKQM